MSSDIVTWSPESICLAATAVDDTACATTLAPAVYDRTCRRTFEAPGFCLLNLGPNMGSGGLRRLMVDLKREMGRLHTAATGQTLNYLSAARFDQQQTTRPHLDGGPAECFLMLGYEPTEVDSRPEISDYARCAYDLSLTPREFLTQHNPMFQAGYEMLQPYTTRVACFSKSDYQIVCVNNSFAEFSTTNPAWQGTLHTATIIAPDEAERRVINSTMIASVPVGTPEPVSQAEQEEFVRTSVIRRRGYDKPHLSDDL